MDKKKYLCPPKLQREFLVIRWPVMHCVVGLLLFIGIAALGDFQFLALLTVAALVTARLDDDGNTIVRWFQMRFNFFFNQKTYRQAPDNQTHKTKEQRRAMRKELPMQRLVNFGLDDDRVRHILPNGKTEYCYFFRFIAPNWAIMTQEEREGEITHYTKLLNTLKCPACWVESDQLIDLSATTEFWSSLSPRYDYITSYIVQEIEGTNVKSCSVQRCVYLVLKSADPDQHFLQTLLSGGYQMQQLKKQEFASLLRCYYVREFIDPEIYTLAEEIEKYPGMEKAGQAVRDKILQSKLCPHRLDFSVRDYSDGRTFRRTLAVKTFPREIQPGLLMSAAGVNNTTFTMHMMPMGGNDIKRMIDEQSRNKNTLLGSNSASTQISAATDIDAINRFYSELSHSEESVWRLGIYVELYAKNREELDMRQRELEEILVRADVISDPLAHEQKEGFQSVQPLGDDKIPELANNMPSSTVAALYPWSYSARMDKHGFPYGRTKEDGPVMIDFTQRSRTVSNGNIVTLGASGKGKSQFTKKILTHFELISGEAGHRYVIDPENEYQDICQNFGGTFIDCARGNFIINPLEVRRIATERDEADSLSDLPALNGMYPISGNMSAYYQHISWLESQFEIMYADKLSRFELAALMMMTQALYESFHINESTDFEGLTATDYPILTDLYTFIESKIREGVSYRHIDVPTMERLLVGIYDSVYGSMAPIFCGYTNIPNTQLIVFGTQQLTIGSRIRTDAVMNNIFSYIQNQVFKMEGITLLIIDEMLEFLQNPIVCRRVTSGYRRFRKYEAYIACCCQQIGPLLSSYDAELSAIADNAAYKFIFNVGTCDMVKLKQALQLTDGEMRCIKESDNYWAVAICGSRPYYFKVGLLPYEAALFGHRGGR